MYNLLINQLKIRNSTNQNVLYNQMLPNHNT